MEEEEIIEILKRYVDFSAYDRGNTSEVLYRELAAELNDAFEERSKERFKRINDSYEQVKMELSALRGYGWQSYLDSIGY